MGSAASVQGKGEQPHLDFDSATTAQTTLPDLPAPWLLGLVHHLTGADKLRLLQTSKQLAALLLQEPRSGCLRLALSVPQTWQGRWQHRAAALRQQARALHSLLALAPDGALHVVLNRGIPPLYASLPHSHITHLSLHGYFRYGKLLPWVDMQPHITADFLRQLQLQACPRLHTLTLGVCTFRLTAEDVAALQEDHAAWLPPSLRRLDASGMRVNYDFQTLLQLFGQQLTHLTCRYWPDHQSPRLACLTQLTHFTVAESTLGDTSYGSGDCGLLDVLLALPHLTHVTARRLELSRQHSSSIVAAGSWQLLRITDSASVASLCRLPLQHIRQLAISTICLDKNSDSSDTSELQEQLDVLAGHPGLQCTPRQNEQLAQPELTVNGGPPALIQLCVNKMAASGVCLHVRGKPWATDLQAWAWLRQLPPAAVTALWVEVPNEPQGWDWQQLVAALPPSILQVVLDVHSSAEGTLSDGTWQQHVLSLGAALSASERHAHVVVALAVGCWQQDAPLLHELQQLVAVQPTRLRLLPWVGPSPCRSS